MNLTDKIYSRLENIFKGKEPFDPDFVRPLIKEDVPSHIKAATLIVLGKFGNETDVFTIIDHIKSEDPKIRINAVKALTLTDSPLVYAFILDLIGDREMKISEFALKFCLKEDFKKTIEYTEMRVKSIKDIDMLKNIDRAFSHIQHDEARRFKVFVGKHIKKIETSWSLGY